MESPSVSCLCVTEKRSPFMPWLLWCFDRQKWAERELVIVDSSPEPVKLPARGDIRVIIAAPGTNVAQKRNLALQAAHGEIITWFDDDDWQHPEKLTWLIEALQNGAVFAGNCKGWFVNLINDRCTQYKAPRQQIIFNSAGFWREAVLPHHFQENLWKASDTRWMRQLTTQYNGEKAIIKRGPLFFWLCHHKNLCNPAWKRSFSQSLANLKELIGPVAWADTDDALEALRMRLYKNNNAADCVTE